MGGRTSKDVIKQIDYQNISKVIDVSALLNIALSR